MAMSGPSLSLGLRGAHVTIGPKGIRRTIGVPGSGLFATDFTPHRSGRVESPVGHESATAATATQPNAMKGIVLDQAALPEKVRRRIGSLTPEDFKDWVEGTAAVSLDDGSTILVDGLRIILIPG